jgi:hypothetical protein
MPQNQLFKEIHEDHENLKGLLEKLVKTSDRAEKNRKILFEKVKFGMVPPLPRTKMQGMTPWNLWKSTMWPKWCFGNSTGRQKRMRSGKPS